MKQVVFHIDESFKWPLVLGNVKNLITYYQQHLELYEIVVVANGEAVTAYVATQEESLHISMNALMEKQVKFHACHNALQSHHIAKASLLSGIEVVDAGVADLVLLQSKGFAYIKP